MNASCWAAARSHSRPPLAGERDPELGAQDRARTRSRSITRFDVDARSDRRERPGAQGDDAVRARALDDERLYEARLGVVSTAGGGGRRTPPRGFLLGHPEACERAPLVLADPPRAAGLALDGVGERADLGRALAEPQRVQVALAEARHRPASAHRRGGTRRAMWFTGPSPTDGLVVGHRRARTARSSAASHRVELEAVAAATILAGAAPSAHASSSGAVSPSWTARSS